MNAPVDTLTPIRPSSSVSLPIVLMGSISSVEGGDDDAVDGTRSALRVADARVDDVGELTLVRLVVGDQVDLLVGEREGERDRGGDAGQVRNTCPWHRLTEHAQGVLSARTRD